MNHEIKEKKIMEYCYSTKVYCLLNLKACKLFESGDVFLENVQNYNKIYIFIVSHGKAEGKPFEELYKEEIAKEILQAMNFN